MSKGKQRVNVDGSDGALRQPLPGLAALRDKLPEAPPPASQDGPVAAEPPASTGPASERTVFARAAKIVLRRERKGHGGKVATRIEGVPGSRREMEEAVREIKRALGCGAALDGGDVVVQGAQVERLVAFLSARGARKVVIGS